MRFVVRLKAAFNVKRHIINVRKLSSTARTEITSVVEVFHQCKDEKKSIFINPEDINSRIIHCTLRIALCELFINFVKLLRTREEALSDSITLGKVFKVLILN